MSLLFLTTYTLGLGILGESFGKLFGIIWDGISWVGNALWSAIKWIGNVLWDAITWIGNLVKNLFQSLIDLILGFFEIIYSLIDGLFYLLYQIGVLAVKVFLLFFETAKLLVSLVVGFARTLASLTYTPSTSSSTGYSEMIGKLFVAAEPLQINVVAYILLFMLWIGTAVAAIRLISSIRVGGE